MNKFKIKIFIFLSITFFVLSLSTPCLARKTIDDAEGFLGTVASGAEIENTDVTTVAGRVIKTGLSIAGLIFLALMVYAGISWMTARGEEEKVKKAQGTITASIIGLAIVVGAYSITYLVSERLISGQTSGKYQGTQADKLGDELLGCCLMQKRAKSDEMWFTDVSFAHWVWDITTESDCSEQSKGDATVEVLDSSFRAGLTAPDCEAAWNEK